MAQFSEWHWHSCQWVYRLYRNGKIFKIHQRKIRNERMKLINNAQQLHKLWSVRLSALGAFFMSIEMAYGTRITIWWQMSASEYFPFLNRGLSCR
ncbi:DUF7940 domain-containing protein [Acinetobacter sp. ANC 4633]